MDQFKFNFELTADETNIILMTLAKAPWEMADGTIQNIRAQIAPQMPAYQEFQEKNKALQSEQAAPDTQQAA